MDNRQDVTLGARLLLCLLLMSFVLAIYMFQDVLLPKHFFTDAGTISNLINYVDLGSAQTDSFVSTAWVFSNLGDDGSQVFLLVGVISVVLLMSFRSQRYELVGFTLLYMVPFTLFNLKLSKEAIVIVMNLSCCLACLSGRSKVFKVVFVASLYLLYAYFFRFYYAFIAVGMVFLTCFFSAHGRLRTTLLCLALVACLVLPGDVWTQLQLARDTVNTSREGLSDSKTIFSNLLTPNGIVTALPNSLYGAVRFLFAPAFSFRPQELLLSMVLWSVIVLMVRNKNYSHPLMALLMANFLIQTFFEPDLGSFLRHMTAYAFCLYAVPRAPANHAMDGARA
ncbi:MULTISPECIES: hypothetical protein [unclassified Pseudomonas]|uniref:hypothetical protein n=1 Tax=unclassified Pseudomonas TaxID=196821 RepID=UPI000C8809C7|nr:MULTISPECIES: hypothetical protein [unclassified Pseudomonas]PMZ92680.1 hypothetical protein C1X61_02030 [Pseudomonas sp. FW215-T2]PNA16747.1 hypothetical protein C1X62_01295 [Pseudomonas sp. FW215-R3]PNB39650.1 hypothetical protein C1X63_01755 [Pseudomonas sp. FW305-131]